MHDALLMGVLQRLTHLVRNPQRRVQGHAMVGRLLDQVLDVATAHELGDEIRLAPLLADVVDGDDVRMVAEPAHGLGLSSDP